MGCYKWIDTIYDYHKTHPHYYFFTLAVPNKDFKFLEVLYILLGTTVPLEQSFSN